MGVQAQSGRDDNARVHGLQNFTCLPHHTTTGDCAEISSPNPVEKETPTAKVLEELLELTRTNHKILRDPASMIPPDYLDSVLGRHSRDNGINLAALRDADDCRRQAVESLRSLSAELEDQNDHLTAALKALQDLGGPLDYLTRQARSGRYSVKKVI